MMSTRFFAAVFWAAAEVAIAAPVNLKMSRRFMLNLVRIAVMAGIRNAGMKAGIAALKRPLHATISIVPRLCFRFLFPLMLFAGGLAPIRFRDVAASAG